jgi:hypothetical protein
VSWSRGRRRSSLDQCRRPFLERDLTADIVGGCLGDRVGAGVVAEDRGWRECHIPDAEPDEEAADRESSMGTRGGIVWGSVPGILVGWKHREVESCRVGAVVFQAREAPIEGVRTSSPLLFHLHFDFSTEFRSSDRLSVSLAVTVRTEDDQVLGFVWAAFPAWFDVVHVRRIDPRLTPFTPLLRSLEVQVILQS